MTRDPQEELVHFLSDLYSMELQALAQLKTAPELAGDPALAADFRAHLAETEAQAEAVRARLEALGGSPSTVKDAVMKLGGKAFLLFAKVQQETPGRLLAHSYSYEAMEWAGYAVLAQLADAAGDETTTSLAHSIQAEERAMMTRLERAFEATEARSHRDLSAEELAEHLRKHLAETHAFELQSIQLLEKAGDIAGDPVLARIYAVHLDETRAQALEVQRRLESLGGKPPLLQDAALRLGALNWGVFFQMQNDTPAKLLAFAYAVEHLEIAAYELLARTARRAGDAETSTLCDGILAEERAMTRRLAEHVGLSVSATLAALRS